MCSNSTQWQGNDSEKLVYEFFMFTIIGASYMDARRNVERDMQSVSQGKLARYGHQFVYAFYPLPESYKKIIVPHECNAMLTTSLYCDSLDIHSEVSPRLIS